MKIPGKLRKKRLRLRVRIINLTFKWYPESRRKRVNGETAPFASLDYQIISWKRKDSISFRDVNSQDEIFRENDGEKRLRLGMKITKLFNFPRLSRDVHRYQDEISCESKKMAKKTSFEWELKRSPEEISTFTPKLPL